MLVRVLRAYEEDVVIALDLAGIAKSKPFLDVLEALVDFGEVVVQLRE